MVRMPHGSAKYIENERNGPVYNQSYRPSNTTTLQATAGCRMRLRMRIL